VAKKIHVIVNPASGQPDTVLHKLNSVFHPAGVKWDVSITHKSGDATRFARQAIEDGVDVVGAYGGDGTVMEVAHAVRDGEIPMAILPGGTANLMSVELGIPKDLVKAAELAASKDSQVRRVDIGQVGERSFILRLSMGFGAEKVKLADRQMKDRWGILAYTIAGLKALSTTQMAQYHIEVDGQTYDLPGKSCLIDNAGNLGISGIPGTRQISVSDGLLDLILIRDTSMGSFIALGAAMADRSPNPESFFHVQGRQFSITTDIPQPMVADGEDWGETPVSVEVVPGVLPILIAQGV
jgi:diacylglycerol kinase (ATP)